MRLRGKTVLIGAILFIAAATGFIAWRGITITLRAAVPADTSHELVNTMRLVGREMAAQSNWLKVVQKPVETMDDARRAIADREVDIAVLRSDQAMPPGTSVVALLKKEQIFLLAPSDSKLDSFSDLKNKSIGVLPGPVQNTAALDRILQFYGVDPANVRRTKLHLPEIATSLKAKQIAAIFVIGEPAHGASAEVYSILARSTRSTPIVIGAPETDALVAAVQYLSAEKILKGAFRGEAPDEDTAAPAIEYRLVARDDVSNLVAGELGRILMSTKARLVNETGVNGIAAPDTDQTSYPIHPGARAYFDGDPPSLLSSFETYFWLGWALIGVLGSLATWLVGRIQGARDAELQDYRHLVLLLSEVRRADRDVLGRLRDDFEETVERLLKHSENGNLSAEEIGRYQLALNLVRDALENREGASRRKRTAIGSRQEKLRDPI
jgi:TRAP-type uncharacterized transport system substrate-binding protein